MGQGRNQCKEDRVGSHRRIGGRVRGRFPLVLRIRFCFCFVGQEMGVRYSWMKRDENRQLEERDLRSGIPLIGAIPRLPNSQRELLLVELDRRAQAVLWKRLVILWGVTRPPYAEIRVLVGKAVGVVC